MTKITTPAETALVVQDALIEGRDAAPLIAELISHVSAVAFPDLETRSLRVPQGAKSGVSAIFGQWPGDETDDDFESAGADAGGIGVSE